LLQRGIFRKENTVLPDFQCLNLIKALVLLCIKGIYISDHYSNVVTSIAKTPHLSPDKKIFT